MYAMLIFFCLNRKRASTKLQELSDEKKKKMKGPNVDVLDEWEEINLNDYNYVIKESDDVKYYAKLNFQRGASLKDIFTHFVNEDLKLRVWNNGGPDMWCYRSGGKNVALNNGVYDSKMIDRVLAHEIRLIGIHQTPAEGGGVQRHLRDALNNSREYFATKYPGARHPGRDGLCNLIARYHITNEVFPILSHNFQSCMDDLGQIIVGDEKLLHFTGNTIDVRDIKSKPDRIGLWFYQLMATLPNDTQFMLHTKLWEAEPSIKVSMPVHRVVKEWCDVVKRHGERDANPDSILCYDSYYNTNQSAQVCRDAGVMFLASAKSNNFNNLVSYVAPKVKAKGEWAGIFSRTRDELFIHKWDKDDNVGKKFVYTNCITKTRRSRSYMHVVPGYDFYKISFSACDKFNRNLHDRKWPYRYGGGGRMGDSGHHHKFALACILQNTFNAHDSLTKNGHCSTNFKKQCLLLADELYE